MAKVIVTRLTVVSTVALLAAAAATAIGCGGASGGTRATGGATGSGGQQGTAGATGTGGSNGTAGSNGAGGGMVCIPSTAALDCPNGINPAAPLMSDFSPVTWANTMGKWHSTACDLTGSIFGGAKPPGDAGPSSSLTNVVNVVAINPSMELKGTIQSGEYGYGGMSFDKCVNTTTYTGIQFTLGGTVAGCDLFVYVQTYDQQAVSNRGGCTGSCYSFPSKKITVDSAPVVVHFTDLAPGTADATKAQIVGIQWQLQSPAGPDGGAQPACADVDLTIDDVKFVSD